MAADHTVRMEAFNCVALLIDSDSIFFSPDKRNRNTYLPFENMKWQSKSRHVASLSIDSQLAEKQTQTRTFSTSFREADI